VGWASFGHGQMTAQRGGRGLEQGPDKWHAREKEAEASSGWAQGASRRVELDLEHNSCSTMALGGEIYGLG
jgi:hypothetical protein